MIFQVWATQFSKCNKHNSSLPTCYVFPHAMPLHMLYLSTCYTLSTCYAPSHRLFCLYIFPLASQFLSFLLLFYILISSYPFHQLFIMPSFQPTLAPIWEVNSVRSIAGSVAASSVYSRPQYPSSSIYSSHRSSLRSSSIAEEEADYLETASAALPVAAPQKRKRRSLVRRVVR
jgi:hypothetical protein